MSLVSFKFVLFLGLTFFTYFVAPMRYQWLVLLVFSYLYYYLCSHNLVIILFAVSLFTYLSARVIYKTENQKTKQLLMKLSILVVLSNLIVIKYSGFIVSNINALFSTEFSIFSFILPLGISYYTLQAISYLYDVGKKKQVPETNLLRFMLYMAYFPQIIQGPIPKYSQLAKQLYVEHEFDYERITHGLQLLAWGIAKKIILADRISVPITHIFNNYAEYHGVFLIFAIICYGFQIYADFSGGIDAIRGISEVFGITLGENFRQPYFSHSIEEFWRRWHISLGAWMREYVFYPLSLSKRLNDICKKLRKTVSNNFGKKFAPFVAMFVVYLLVGIWHGAQWKYVVYGIWNGLFIMSGILLENSYASIRQSLKIDQNAKWFRAFQILRTFIIVSIGRLISRAATLDDAVKIFRLILHKTFDLSFFEVEHLSSLGINFREWILCFVVVIIILFVDYIKEKGIDIRSALANRNIVIRWAFYIALILALLIFGKYGPGYDASSFIYGNF